MRTLLSLASAFALVISCWACKGKPEHQAPPANAANGSGGSGRAAPDIVLPHSNHSPIVKTTAKLDEATLHKLQDMKFEGFTPHAHGLNPAAGMMEIQERTRDHPAIWAVVTITSCDDKYTMVTCLPMDLAQWKAEPRFGELKAILPADLRAQSDTVFEVGSTVVEGATMIYTYQLGQSISHPSQPGDTGSSFDPGGFSYTDAYFLYYNDGVNQIRVVAEYKDDPVKTKEMMAALTPKVDLEHVAAAFMDVYLHAW